MLIKQHLLDKRVVERALQRRLLSAEEYARAIDALPDLSDKVKRDAPRETASTNASAAEASEQLAE